MIQKILKEIKEKIFIDEQIWQLKSGCDYLKYISVVKTVLLQLQPGFHSISFWLAFELLNIPSANSAFLRSSSAASGSWPAGHCKRCPDRWPKPANNKQFNWARAETTWQYKITIKSLRFCTKRKLQLLNLIRTGLAHFDFSNVITAERQVKGNDHSVFI